MYSARLEIPNCKVKVRSYVLVQNPSRWNVKGERVIVQSPIQNLSTTLQEIPVKRYFQDEEQNSVCMLGVQDIEGDTNDIYEELQVSRRPSWINAHGVALCRGPSSYGFEYELGDPFWINVGPNTNHYTTSVPVINLKTHKSGSIAVGHVCWYPHVQGPDDELWTLGGEVRNLKLRGSGNFSYWSWVVCQKLDGTLSTTKSVEIPTKRINLGDRWKLTAQEARFLYDQKYQYMDERLRCPPKCELLTPPATPPTQREDSGPPAKKAKYDQVQTGRTPFAEPDAALWGRIYSWAMQRQGQFKVLGSSLVQSALTTTSAVHESMPRSFSITAVEDSSSDFDWSDDTSSIASVEISVLDYRSAEAEGQKWLCASTLMEMGRRPGFPLGVKTSTGQHAHPETYHIDTTISGRYDHLCDLKDPGCTYSSQSTCAHFHVPPSKCTFTISTAEPLSPPHEHCISRLRPLPGQAGPCLLTEKVDRKHICCGWADKDKDDWPQVTGEEYDRGKILEADRFHIRIHDRSRWINRKNQALPFSSDIIKELGCDGARLFFADLERGVVDEEVMGVYNKFFMANVAESRIKSAHS
ncbi:hypothetical protein LHYA1_G007874 [Lachnellula hyalina]|uniref:Uncharacterized protein n=1 Tax=Lachnellula hyalina TaxID=1316788 RepID=A0A8H8QUQ6_9HELO|nr:uncharacterized protein LHYA1_G007874 [Lachnellula hyalina]TVY23138.1 hypothetical protein LHYA1_G007874 [Lachnellula hyalina]